jgi:branched-chain amino acid aminotransferase
MGSFASVNGVVVPAEQARVSVLDNGFTFGDSVYETLRTYRGRPFERGRHFKRLRASAGRVGFEIPAGDEVLSRQLDDLLARGANEESYIRLIATRGVGDISYDFEKVAGPTLVMVVKPWGGYPAAHYSEGVPVAIVSIRRNHPLALDPAIKSCNLLNNVLAVREAQARGASEAILLNHRDEVAEGAASNVFVVRAGILRTPPLDAGILAGITREVVLELAARLGAPAREEPVSVWDLRNAEEAFLTSTTREVMPIRAIETQPVGAGRPGPLTLRLLEAFRAEAPGRCA